MCSSWVGISLLMIIVTWLTWFDPSVYKKNLGAYIFIGYDHLHKVGSIYWETFIKWYTPDYVCIYVYVNCHS